MTVPAAVPAEPAGVELLRVEGLVKNFPGVVALDGVSFDLHAGEVHVLLGENGAGKSTLIKCLAGVYQPDGGQVFVDGSPVHIHNTAQAQALGIATIYQEFNLVPQLSVAENVMLGRQPRSFGIVDPRRMHAEASRAMERVGLRLDPRTPVSRLGVARQQLVEIAKALSLDARVLILDEPTAALADDEVDRLLELMAGLRESGVGMVFISHHLDEIRRIGQRVTVLRDGRSVGTVPADTSTDELVQMMVGRSIESHYPRVRTDPGEELLSVEHLTSEGVFEDVSLTVRAGEVVGLAGLVGAGRTEVLRAVFGADRYDSGIVTVRGSQVARHDVHGAIDAGLGLVPEDRKAQGLILGASVGDNLGLVSLRKVTRAGLVDRGRLRELARDAVKDLGIRTPGIQTTVNNLSGGNQQKVVMGKWLAADPAVLLLDEPTRGVDVGAKVEIYKLINKLTASGRGVLLVSSDLPEVLGICDRVLVMAQGRIVGELTHEEATQDSVMALAVKEVESTRARLDRYPVCRPHPRAGCPRPRSAGAERRARRPSPALRGHGCPQPGLPEHAEPAQRRRAGRRRGHPRLRPDLRDRLLRHRPLGGLGGCSRRHRHRIRRERAGREPGRGYPAGHAHRRGGGARQRRPRGLRQAARLHRHDGHALGGARTRPRALRRHPLGPARCGRVVRQDHRRLAAHAGGHHGLPGPARRVHPQPHVHGAGDVCHRRQRGGSTALGYQRPPPAADHLRTVGALRLGRRPRAGGPAGLWPAASRRRVRALSLIHI